MYKKSNQGLSRLKSCFIIFLIMEIGGSLCANVDQKEMIKNALAQDPPAMTIDTGLEIPSEGYCDQPYVVKLKDGTWLCVMTTGKGKEGERGQHVVSTRSTDKGKTWSSLVDIEPATGPEASWVMPIRGMMERPGLSRPI